MTDKDIKEQDALQNEEELSFWDHLEVLRWSLVRIAGVLAVITVFTFMAMPYIFDQYILAPTTSNFFVYYWIWVNRHKENIEVTQIITTESSYCHQCWRN